VDATPAPTRYARQTRVEGIGEEGQSRLGASHALIVGVGALGCVSADLLARAGVGTLTLVDRDLVDRTNLHRQTLYTDDDANERRPKALAARERLEAANPQITIRARVMDFTPARARGLVDELGTPDVLIDGTDNFATRYLLNDLAVAHAIPFVYGGAIGASGSIGVFMPDDGPCLRCLAPDPPPAGSQPTCESVGVLAPASAMVGAEQAAEAIKILLGLRERVGRSLRSFDLWSNTRSCVSLERARDPGCICCVRGVYSFLEAETDAPGHLCGRSAVQVSPRSGSSVDLDRVAASMGLSDREKGARVVRGRVEHAGATLEFIAFDDGRAIVEGTDDAALARSVYDRYIGT